MSRNNRVCFSSLRLDSAQLVAAILCIVTQHSSHIMWRPKERLRRRLSETKASFTCHGTNLQPAEKFSWIFHSRGNVPYLRPVRTELTNQVGFLLFSVVSLSAYTHSATSANPKWRLLDELPRLYVRKASVVGKFRQLWRSHRAGQNWLYQLNNWPRWWRFSHSFWKARRLNFPLGQRLRWFSGNAANKRTNFQPVKNSSSVNVTKGLGQKSNFSWDEPNLVS